MHSPLRVKIQNALNKALQLEHTDVLFVGGRRRNRKRRKHAKDKRKSKKYEGKETPVLKAKAYNGNKGNYVALVADDDISLSPSMVDDLFGKSAIDVIGRDDEDDEHDEIAYADDDQDSKDSDQELPELCKTKSDFIEELNIVKLTNERPISCDTGYDSEAERKVTSSESEQEGTDDEHETADNTIVRTGGETQTTNAQDDVFTESEDDFDNESMPDELLTTENNLMTEILKAEVEENNIVIGQSEADKEDIDVTSMPEEEVSSYSKNKDDKHRFKDLEEEPSIYKDLPEPRVIANFDYDEEEEEEIYTKQPKSWFRRKAEEQDEELRPLICCGDDNGMGFACCNIL